MKRHIQTLNEMASRLRSAGRYDNALADRVILLVSELEDKKDDGFTPPILPKDGYASTKKQLAAVTAYRSGVCPADIASCLTMATLIYKWQKMDVRPPQVRLGSGGFVVAEWDGKDGGHVMIQHGEVFYECCPQFILEPAIA